MTLHPASLPILILVSGLPCTGKTTLASQIATHFGYPLVWKDGIKEILFDHLGQKDRTWSKLLSETTYALIFQQVETLLKARISLVAEGNFSPDPTRLSILALQEITSFQLFDLHCVTDADTLLSRIQTRTISGNRHPGHLDQIVYQEMVDLVTAGETGALDLGGGYIKVDTTDFHKVSIQTIANAIETHAFG
jgi:predicted kinase